MCCPLAGLRIRIDYFKRYPNMVKAYIRAGQKFRETHPEAKSTHLYNDVYEWFYRDVFCYSQAEFEQSKEGMFGIPDYKQFLEEQFNIKL